MVAQGVGNNLWMGAILAARYVFAVEQVGLQLGALEEATVDLQCHNMILVQERDQAAWEVERAVAAMIDLRRVAEQAAEHLAVERKRREDA